MIPFLVVLFYHVKSHTRYSCVVNDPELTVLHYELTYPFCNFNWTLQFAQNYYAMLTELWCAS